MSDSASKMNADSSKNPLNPQNSLAPANNDSNVAEHNTTTLTNTENNNHPSINKNNSTATANDTSTQSSSTITKSSKNSTKTQISSTTEKISSSGTKSSSSSRVISSIATPGCGSNKPVKVQYTNQRVIGNGSFGVVYKADLCGNSLEYPDSDFEEAESKETSPSSSSKRRRTIAIKKVLQDKRFKNRELTIMRNLKHCNIVKLKFFFYSMGDQKDEVYLNLILQYVPETVYRVSRHYAKAKQSMPMIFVRLYMYQLLRALAHIHSTNICHRDIKPQNLLVDPNTAILKLCDFGSAKQLVAGEPNVSYICSRYYRAPELIFGATNYTCTIDVWSAGCVLAELMLGQPIFPGDSGVDQLVEIIKLLGTPTKEAIKEMNPNYTEFKFPTIKAHPWSKVFKSKTPESAIALCADLLEYSPKKRLGAFEALTHSFFDEIRKPGLKLPNDNPLPPIFNFTEQELNYSPALNRLLLPNNVQDVGNKENALST